MQSKRADVLAEDVRHFGRLFEDHVDWQPGFIAGHRGEVQLLDPLAAIETATVDRLPLIVVVHESFRQFACAITAVIQEDDRIAVLDRWLR